MIQKMGERELVTIFDFQNGKRIRKATREEYDRYRKDLSSKSKNGQLSGEVSGKPYGIRGLIYMQNYPRGGLHDEE